MPNERDHEITPGFSVHEVSDEELAAASPTYREHLAKRAYPINFHVLAEDFRGKTEFSQADARWLLDSLHKMCGAYDELSEANERLLSAGARALERCEVADDPSGAADEAAAILRTVVNLDGTYREHPPKPLVFAFRRAYIQRTGPMSLEEAIGVVDRLLSGRSHKTLAEEIAMEAARAEIERGGS